MLPKRFAAKRAQKLSTQEARRLSAQEVGSRMHQKK
jgi:hypothetical protein